jgi:hypothetical protein
MFLLHFLPYPPQKKNCPDEMINIKNIKSYQLNAFEDSAMDVLYDRIEHDYETLNNYLARLQQPDVPNLPELIIAYFKAYAAQYKNAGAPSLSQIRISSRMTLEQLDALLSRRSDFIYDGYFVNEYLRRLAPSDDVSIRTDDKEREAYYKRVRKGRAHPFLLPIFFKITLCFHHSCGRSSSIVCRRRSTFTRQHFATMFCDSSRVVAITTRNSSWSFSSCRHKIFIAKIMSQNSERIQPIFSTLEW